MIQIDRPKFEIGSLTNHGRVRAYYYRYKQARWSYELGEVYAPIFKAEDELEVIEAVLKLQPQPSIDLGDSVDNKTVAGIMQHSDQGYSYYLIQDGMETPYIHWVPQESITAHLVQK